MTLATIGRTRHNVNTNCASGIGPVRSQCYYLDTVSNSMSPPEKERHVRIEPPSTRHDPVATIRENRIVPLYHQVEQLIRHRVVKQHYPPGSQIPSEHELCRELKVSRITVREALRELVRQGMLVKVQGKGTFVSPDAATTLPPIKYTGALEDVYERVLRLNVVDVDISRIPVPAMVRQVLNLPAEEDELTCIKRLRYIDDEPFSFTVNFLPVSIGDRIKKEELFTVPLMAILEEEMKIPIVRALETVEAAPADPEVSGRLRMPVLYPVMHVTRTMYTEGDKPFELVETFYRADKYKYSVNLTRVQRGGKWTWSQQAPENPQG
jgi:GntR family transcriptional regulator